MTIIRFPSAGAAMVGGAMLFTAAQLGVVAPAYSQGAGECACVAQNGPGMLSEAAGEVLVSQRAGMLPAAPGAQLAPGSRVLVGPRSSALVSFPGCELRLAANAQLDVVARGSQLCLRVDGPDVVAGEGGSGFGLPEGIFGSLFVGGLAVGLLDGGKSPVSP